MRVENYCRAELGIDFVDYEGRRSGFLVNLLVYIAVMIFRCVIANSSNM